MPFTAGNSDPVTSTSARVIVPSSSRIERATKEPDLLGNYQLRHRPNVPVSQYLSSRPSRTYRERIHLCVHSSNGEVATSRRQRQEDTVKGRLWMIETGT